MDHEATTMTTNNKYLTHTLERLLGILRSHPGKNNAISMIDLYEEFSGEVVERDEHHQPTENVATLSRAMRNLINELIFVHSIPIMSSTSAGYWIVTDKDELQQVYHELMSRGLSSLQKAAKLKQISLVDAVQQLALDLTDDDSEMNTFIMRGNSKSKIKTELLGDVVLSKEAKLAAITKYMKVMVDSPKEYAQEIHQLQKMFGPKLVPQSVYDSIIKQANKVNLLANQTIEETSKLTAMMEV